MVIIGLLIGGIFVGQSLIHNAQLNAVITEFNRYQTAVGSFKQQYQALPGDMNNATSFWGVAGGTGSDAACSTTASTTTATCNGNGDGIIDSSTGSVEYLRFWQHLANAKIIEGQYNGVLGSGETLGVNVPASKYVPAGWATYPASWIPASGDANNFSTDYGDGQVLSFGGTNVTNTDGPQLPPKDAWSIDKKIDDGEPGTGNVIASWWPGCTNAASKTDTGTTYKLSVSGTPCALRFIPGF